MDVPKNITPMSEQEAWECVSAIKENMESLRFMLLELHRRRGWEALGYDSWDDCATQEFGRSRSYVFKLLAAAQVEESLGSLVKSPIGDSVDIPVSQLTKLAKLPPDQQVEGLLRANEIAQAQGKKRNAVHVAQAVKLVKQKSELPLAEDSNAQAPGYEREAPADLSKVESPADLDAIIDSRGVRAFAQEFVVTTSEIRGQLRSYYPGVDDIIRTELGEQVLARIQSIDASAVNQPVNTTPNTVQQELAQQADKLGLSATGSQVLSDVERNHTSPTDLNDRPFVSAVPRNTYVNVTIDPFSNVSHLQDDQLKQLIKDAKQVIRVVKLELNKRHHPKYLK